MGATFTDGDRYTLKSGADLSTKKGFLVKITVTGGRNTAVLSTAATDKHLGVIEDGGRVSGDNCSVVLVNGQGSYKGVAGGTIAVDDYLTADSSGRLVATTTAGDRVVGRALGAAVVTQQVEYLRQDFKYA